MSRLRPSRTSRDVTASRLFLRRRISSRFEGRLARFLMLSNKMSDCKLTIPVVSSTGSSGKRDSEIRATSGPTELRIRRTAVKPDLDGKEIGGVTQDLLLLRGS